MKKYFAWALAAAMVLSFAGCGNGTGKTESSQAVSSAAESQAESSKAESSESTPAISGEITLDNLMNAPESPEEDFTCMDHGDGNVELTEYLGSAEVVVIPKTWHGKEITSIGTFVFANESTVKAIRLSDSIETVQKSAFINNGTLEIVVCGEGLKTIEEAVFQNCVQLNTVVLNDGLERIDGIAFANCGSITELEIPESVTEIQPGAIRKSNDSFKLLGKAGSEAERYAESEDIPFEER